MPHDLDVNRWRKKQNKQKKQLQDAFNNTKLWGWKPNVIKVCLESKLDTAEGGLEMLLGYGKYFDNVL